MTRLLPESAHDPDAGERLLEVGRNQRDLLPREPVGTGGSDPEGHAANQQHREHRERDKREPGVEEEEDDGRAYEGERRGEERDDSVRDELVERLDVVGQPGDQHPRLVARVEPDRQRLKVGEDARAKVLQRALADPAHQVGLGIGGGPVDRGCADERHKDPRERARVARSDAVVDRATGQVRRRERGGGSEHERHEHQDHPAAVGPKQREQLAELARAPALAAKDLPETPHSPATSRSTGLRVRNTWSGRPRTAISL